jgi:ectoine hydroxylase-related dioxygenase (phytanoyl-CoA dioxygenase family)
LTGPGDCPNLRAREDIDVDSASPGQDVDITISTEELEQEGLSAASHRVAALLLHTRGYVILRGAVPAAVVAEVAEGFGDVFADCVASEDGDSLHMAGIRCRIARKTQAVFWERNHRWRIFPRLRAPFDSAWILANPFATALLRQSLGENFYCKFVSSDTCLSGAEIQSPHREMDPGLSWEPRGYIVNVPLQRCDLSNGPLEIWPSGSHLWRDDVMRGLGFDDTVQDARNPDFEWLASLFPSRRLILDPGDVLIRDPALMHRGTVNHTSQPRTMLGVCYFREGLTHNYGRLDLSLDRELYEQLAPEIRHLFAHEFEAPVAV